MKILYGWEQDGKVYLSAMRPDVRLPRRPANQYDTREQALAEAASRGAIVRWEAK